MDLTSYHILQTWPDLSLRPGISSRFVPGKVPSTKLAAPYSAGGAAGHSSTYCVFTLVLHRVTL